MLKTKNRRKNHGNKFSGSGLEVSDFPVELYKKYRPSCFDEMVGNKESIQTLQGMLNKNRVPHVILFHGPPGTGKTTFAKILANKLCQPIDIHEENSANFRGIDYVRDLISYSRRAPVGDCKTWILDEVHQLTSQAQEALLKLFEDTPKDTYYFLCTTNPNKLISALRNRCTQFYLELLSKKQMRALLSGVAHREGLGVGSDVLEDLVEAAEGSARLALIWLGYIQHNPSQGIPDKISDEIEGDIKSLCQAIIYKKKWGFISEILKTLEQNKIENVRWRILAYARIVLLGGGKNAKQAYNVIRIFEDPFEGSGAAGLAAACFESING